MKNGQCLCSECKSELERQADFCTHCGALFRTDQDCVNHEGMKATRVCVVCKRPLCSICVILHNGAGYCGNHYPDTRQENTISPLSADEYRVTHGVPEGAQPTLKLVYC